MNRNNKNNKNNRRRKNKQNKNRQLTNNNTGIERPVYIFGSRRGSYFRWITLTRNLYIYNNFISTQNATSQNYLKLDYTQIPEWIACASLYNQCKITELKITVTPAKVLSANTIINIGTIYIAVYESDTKQDAKISETETGFAVPPQATTPITKTYLFRGTSDLTLWKPTTITSVNGPVIYAESEHAYGPNCVVATIRFEIGIHFRQGVDV